MERMNLLNTSRERSLEHSRLYRNIDSNEVVSLHDILVNNKDKYITFQDTLELTGSVKRNPAYDWIRNQIGFNPIWCIKITDNVANDFNKAKVTMPYERKYILLYNKDEGDLETNYYEWGNIMYLFNESTQEEWDNEKKFIKLENILDLEDAVYIQLLKRKSINPQVYELYNMLR